MKKMILIAGIFLSILGITSQATAQQVRWGVNVRWNGGWGGGYCPPPVYYPQPVYYPSPVYYAPVPYYNPYVPCPPTFAPAVYRRYCW